MSSNRSLSVASFTAFDSSCKAKKQCFGNLSSNVKSLALSTVLFTSITVAQIIFGTSVNSLALLADAAAMAVDVVCYVAAIYGEMIPETKAAFKRNYQLSTSFISISILFALSIYFVYESATGLQSIEPIEWSKSAATQLGNPLLDPYGRDAATGTVEYGLPGTVQMLQSLSAPGGILARRGFNFNGISSTYYNGILPTGISDEEACPDIGPMDKCDQDDAAGSGEVILAFGLVGLLIDLICLGYAFWPLSSKKKDIDIKAKEEKDGDEKNMNTLAALAHVAADLIRSGASIIAGAYIITNPGDASAAADNIAGLVASVTIVLGALLGYYEWHNELRDGDDAPTETREDSTNELDGEEKV